MRDDEIRSLLTAIDVDVDLESRTSADVRVLMLRELDSTLGRSDVVPVTTSRPSADSPSQRRRWVPAAAAAVAITILVGGLMFGSSRGSDTITDSVPTVPPTTLNESTSFLRACVDFQEATTVDGVRWPEMLAAIDATGTDDPAFTAALATALEALAMERRAADVAGELRAIAVAVRSGDPAVDITSRLRAIEAQWLVANGLVCLS